MVADADLVWCRLSELAASHHALIDDADVRHLQQDAEDGVFVLPATSWQRIDDAVKPDLLTACFWIAAGLSERGHAIAERLDLDAGARSAHADTWGATRLVYGISAWEIGKPGLAIELLVAFNERFRGTALAPMGRYVLANVWTADVKQFGKAVRLYGDIAEQHPDSPFAERALVAMAVAAAHRNDFTVLAEAQQRLAEAAESNPRHLALGLVASVVPINSALEPVEAQRTGPRDPISVGIEVHRHRWEYPVSPALSLAPHVPREGEPSWATMHRFEIEFVSSAPGVLVDTARLRLGYLEPQPSRLNAAKGDHRLVFYRLPWLMRPNTNPVPQARNP